MDGIVSSDCCSWRGCAGTTQTCRGTTPSCGWPMCLTLATLASRARSAYLFSFLVKQSIFDSSGACAALAIDHSRPLLLGGSRLLCACNTGSGHCAAGCVRPSKQPKAAC